MHALEVTQLLHSRRTATQLPHSQSVALRGKERPELADPLYYKDF